MSSVIWSFVKYCASFHLMYYLCACHLCLPNAISNCFALNSGMLISLSHLNIWRFFATSFTCLCLFSFDQGKSDYSCDIEVLQTNVYFAEIDKAFLWSLHKLQSRSRQMPVWFFSSFQWEGPKQWWIEELFLMLCRVCTVVLW